MNPVTLSAKLSRETLMRLAELSTLQTTLPQQQARADELTAGLVKELFHLSDPGASFIDAQGVTVAMTETRGLPEVTDESLNEVMPLMPVEFRQLGALIVYRPQVVHKAFVALTGENKTTFEKACRFNRIPALSIYIPDTVEVSPEISEQEITRIKARPAAGRPKAAKIVVHVDTSRATRKIKALGKQAKKTARLVKKAVKKAAPKKKARR